MNGYIVDARLVPVYDQVERDFFHLNNHLDVKEELCLDFPKVLYGGFCLRTGSPLHIPHTTEKMPAPVLRKSDVSSVGCKEVAVLAPYNSFGTSNCYGSVYNSTILLESGK